MAEIMLLVPSINTVGISKKKIQRSTFHTPKQSIHPSQLYNFACVEAKQVSCWAIPKVILVATARVTYSIIYVNINWMFPNTPLADRRLLKSYLINITSNCMPNPNIQCTGFDSASTVSIL